MRTIINKATFLATQLLCLIKLLWHVCVKLFCLVVFPWVGLFDFVFVFCLSMGQRMIIWGVGALLVPLQLFTTPQREKTLQTQLCQLRSQLEEVVREEKEMDRMMKTEAKERKKMEILLIEAEEEKNRAIKKVQQLQTTVQDLEIENLNLKEEMESILLKSEANEVDKEGVRHVNSKSSELKDRAWDHDFERRGKSQSDYPMDKLADYHNSEENDLHKNCQFECRKKSSSHFPLPPITQMKSVARDDEMLYKWKGIALVQSAFSACLSLLVGMIAWKAKDPCMPLVIALFIVVGMSLNSVVKFFSRTENRLGSDALALLSFNWFILGTIAYPTLPNIVQIVTPLASKLGYLLASWLGLTLS